ncbi:hypothetical protein EYF80_029324 [Liparis tanakae]|uniref:Uncharacterized protein n=1 Tax=Liparis tanakae TaxID=230148 RepID=A0A4Z2H5Z7_9TELE|nr:hypothetical protein EYF80_029324 [Liparis tanakae]
MSVSFPHPLVFYGEKLTEEPYSFTVSTDGEDFNGSCTGQEEDCRRNVSFPLGAKKCVTLRGDGAFRDTGRICLSGEPPLDVTLSCRHLNVSVSWQHGGPRPGAGFRVHVGGTAGHQVSDTTALRFDLSRFVWASERRYLGFHFVTVTAKEGRSQSASVTKTFSYKQSKAVEVRCVLDFPAVDLNDSESGATLSFRNPLAIHEELRPASGVEFTASSEEGGAKDGVCSAADAVCRLDLAFPEGAKKCVKTLTGSLLGPGGGGEVAFNETGPVCASSATEASMVTLGVMLLLFFIAVFTVIIAVWKVKACTMKTLPKPLISPMETQEGLRYATVSCREDISPLTVTDHIAWREEEEEEDEEALQCGGGDHLPCNQYAAGGLSEGSGDDSGDDSGKTETVEMEEQEQEEEEEQEEEQEAALHGGGGADFLPIELLYAEGELSDRELSEVSCDDSVSPYDCRHDL